MVNSVIDEVILVVLLFVQSNHSRDIDVLEDFHVFVGVLPVSVLRIPLLNRTHESCKFARDDPVEVAVFDPLVVFVFLDVE